MIVRSLLRDQSGAAAEFALVLPIALIFIFGIIDAGRFMWAYNRAEKATQVGARAAVVTNVISTGLGTQDYVGVNGLTQGDRIPASALSPVTCSCTGGTLACTCSGTCPTGYATADTTGFNYVVARMQQMEPRINQDNVQVIYRGSGLGFAGDPNGIQVSPLVTVKLSNSPSATALKFTPITSLLFATITMPTFSTTLTGEDLSGTQSN
jgi:Flp pilus assembly protein TadG